jgi:hypothetical protein
MGYKFILNNEDKSPVVKMCKCLKVIRNACYHRFRFKFSMVLETLKMRLPKRVRQIYEENRQIYGSSRIQKKGEREGLIDMRSTVGLLMKQMGLKSVLSRKYGFTTVSKHTYPIANNEILPVDNEVKKGFMTFRISVLMRDKMT